MLAKLLQCMTQFTEKHLRLCDILIILTFLLFATLCHIGRTCAPPPEIDLRSGDAANIASFCAGLDNQALFKGDMILEDPKDFRFYWTIHIPLIRTINKITCSYGQAFLALFGFHIFLFLTGFYFLGILLLKSRFWAVLLSFVIITYGAVGVWGTYWGTWTEPIPRDTFVSLLGFLWFFAIYFHKSPKYWPIVMGFAGLLVYVHSVSAPAIAFSLWFAYWWFVPSNWSNSRKITYLFFCGIVFCVVAAPYIYNYFLVNLDSGTGETHLQIREIIDFKYSRGISEDNIWAIKTFLFTVLIGCPTVSLGILGVLILFSCSEWRKNAEFKLILLWATGVIIFLLLFIGGDRAFAYITDRVPVIPNLIRNARYIIPISLILFMMGVVCIERNFQNWIGKRIVYISIIVIMIYILNPLGIVQQLRMFPVLGMKSLLTGYQPTKSPLAEAVTAVDKLTLPGSRILPIGMDPLVIRYAAIRPVVWTYKDGGSLIISNHKKAFRWYQIKERFMETTIKARHFPEKRTIGYLQLSRELNAEYLLIDNSDVKQDTTFSDKRIWSNSSYSLYRVANK
jgi:hypothetical protein